MVDCDKLKVHINTPELTTGGGGERSIASKPISMKINLNTKYY